VIAHGDLPGILADYQGKNFGFASRNFYAEFLAVRNIASDYQKYFGALEVRPPEQSHQMVVARRVDFCRLADYLKLDRATLMECNPDLRKPVKSGLVLIPAGHVLTLPERVAATKQANMPRPDNLSSARESTGELYRVKAGDTLSAIARKFVTSATLLTEINALERPSVLRVGQYLKVPAGKGAAVATDTRLAQGEVRNVAGLAQPAAPPVTGAF